MTDTPWQGDACGLVDAFRAGERSPVEELEASLTAIERSPLNSFSHVDAAGARRAAAAADVSKPFGGVPTGIKQLEPVAGWPHTEASLVFKDRIADFTSLSVERLLERGGAVPVGQTTSSEFGGLNVSVTKINGVTRNPWNLERTCGGSSSGSASSVAGGLVSLATGSDGGGSIRIPAGYTGLLGMKGTLGRIARGPKAYMRPYTVVMGNPARSVRDAARFFDVCGDSHPMDPSSLPRHPSFEAGLGQHDLAGKTIAIVPNLGGVTLDAGVEDHLRAQVDALVASTGMRQVEIELKLPDLAAHWAMGNLATLLADLGPNWPRCVNDLTSEIAIALIMAQSLYNLHTAAVAEEMRMQANEAMAAAFGSVDFLVTATNPGPAFAAEATTSKVGEDFIDRAISKKSARRAFKGAMVATQLVSAFAPNVPNKLLDAANRLSPEMVAMGGLTIISNLYGNPAVSIPAGTVDGLPVGMQVLAPHHADAALFDVALAVERENPWPLVVPQAETVAVPASV